jgi:hypothetical protein
MWRSMVKTTDTHASMIEDRVATMILNVADSIGSSKGDFLIGTPALAGAGLAGAQSNCEILADGSMQCGLATAAVGGGGKGEIERTATRGGFDLAKIFTENFGLAVFEAFRDHDWGRVADSLAQSLSSALTEALGAVGPVSGFLSGLFGGFLGDLFGGLFDGGGKGRQLGDSIDNPMIVSNPRLEATMTELLVATQFGVLARIPGGIEEEPGPAFQRGTVLIGESS